MQTAILQALLNGLMTGALIAIPAIGFTAIFAVLRYPSFAIAGYITIGAFAGWSINVTLGLPIWAALPAAALVAACAAVATEQTIIARLRPSGALTAAIGSIAMNLVLENIVRFFYGNDLRGFDVPLVPDVRFWGLRVGMQQIQTLGISIVVMLLVFLFLSRTRFGRAMRAVADNADLARLKGIDPRLVSLVAVALAGALAGLGGVLLGADTSIDPLTGFRILLSVFAAAVLGGLGSVPGAVVGALTIGVAEELSLLVLPATYRGAVGFVAILVMLTFRPRGLLGERAL
ncbi:branched-chain amino acid ABC transporter permease [Acuticoccus kandeliae]|uniref:branched-chain amino acid ABC transporter permease n=1 Tax=Acuticoccus kandeliae TaxID=2073160 RepID=UPI00196A7840|nr:branched-chain amino acid ABC transporter permease [Acuticoccus kandeliae]